MLDFSLKKEWQTYICDIFGITTKEKDDFYLRNSVNPFFNVTLHNDYIQEFISRNSCSPCITLRIGLQPKKRGKYTFVRNL